MLETGDVKEVKVGELEKSRRLVRPPTFEEENISISLVDD